MTNQQSLSVNTIGSFFPTKNFEETEGINSMDFSFDGKYLITASNDNTIHVYNCLTGNLENEFFSKKYGVNHLRWTGNGNTVIYASTKVNHNIRYHSLHDNKYIRFFKGHESRVTSLSVSKRDDTFLSASEDSSVRLWDYRSPNTIGILNKVFSPMVTYNQTGELFAIFSPSSSLMENDQISANDPIIKIYEIRSFNKGPISSCRLKEQLFSTDGNFQWSNMEFSSNGEHLLLSTFGSEIFVFNVKNEKIEYSLKSRQNREKAYLPATFSPDSQFILSGSTNNLLHVYQTETGNEILTLDSLNMSPQIVKFNPSYFLIASTSRNKLIFWTQK
ncbi:wd repeat-containing protein [Anaeramoeba flamelloides]|uniref:Wd repeat-containing protein n=1 Tax=Anaeramoeba flamelloides TaxID=1746091 RepID=A0AAV7Y4A5_9EUKA|nr:wd repeat-containing protein [Anaeramoeba flamelloides]KAJ6240207.1 wd repeat-containing protein [Anaeramoeba flamelloides]